MNVNHKVILITGAGSGMGREMAIQLIQRGANVVGLDFRLPQLLETQQICHAGDDQFLPLECNITDYEKVKTLPDIIMNHFGQIDAIINNAGIIQPFIRVNDLTMEQIKHVVDVNFYGCVYITKVFLPFLLLRPEAHIVNTSSMGGFSPIPGQSIYGASKAAVKLFTEGLYSELKETNVRVTVVFPGGVATNITSNSGLNMPKFDKSGVMQLMAADKAATIILDAMEKNKYRVLVGSDAKFLDFLSRLFPEYATNFIRNKMKALLR
jgi:NADP-dependent 3-hydroxy acid dehydrogenase YdfG